MDIQFLKMNITNKKLLIVSHDAGGAEILSSYLIEKKIKGDFILSGPAKKIFKEKNLSKNLINKSPKIFDYEFDEEVRPYIVGEDNPKPLEKN